MPVEFGVQGGHGACTPSMSSPDCAAGRSFSSWSNRGPNRGKGTRGQGEEGVQRKGGGAKGQGGEGGEEE